MGRGEYISREGATLMRQTGQSVLLRAELFQLFEVTKFLGYDTAQAIV